jgi:hypothetical protein
MNEYNNIDTYDELDELDFVFDKVERKGKQLKKILVSWQKGNTRVERELTAREWGVYQRTLICKTKFRIVKKFME